MKKTTLEIVYDHNNLLGNISTVHWVTESRFEKVKKDLELEKARSKRLLEVVEFLIGETAAKELIENKESR